MPEGVIAGTFARRAMQRGAWVTPANIGLADIVPASQCDEADLIDTQGTRRDAAEHAMDKVRAKFGSTAIKKGRSL